MTVGLRRPPSKPSELTRIPPDTLPAGLKPLRAFLEEQAIRLDQLWTWCTDQYRASQNPSGLAVSAGGGLPGSGGGSEDAEILALYALKKGGC